MPVISGTVLDDTGNPVAGRIVRAYRRDTGELLGGTLTSDGTSPTDPDWGNVVALLHFDGDLTDETGRVWINSGVTTDNTYSLYNNYAVFSGSSQMTAPIPALGTDDFTIEVWVNRDISTDYRCIFDSRDGNSRNGLAIYTSSALTDNVPVIWEDTQILQGSSKITAIEWVHVAIVRESGILYYYVNGSLIGSGSFTRDLTNTTAIIGSTYINMQAYLGLMDEFRITKGVARYTGNFTPPAAPHPDPNGAPPLPLGKYVITTAYTGECNVICLDDSEGTTYNDLILRATPA